MNKTPKLAEKKSSVLIKVLTRNTRCRPTQRASDRRNDAMDFVGEEAVKKSVPKPRVTAGMLACSLVLSGALLGCSWIF